ncbi:hypothetical protein BD779DRAFT_1685674 [Infundibulicybe gibba]|nr:hypothetical protein BD779DRAFT_1685674 [Infundibulicybe gibba]
MSRPCSQYGKEVMTQPWAHASQQPVVLVGAFEGSFLASFGLGWGVTIGAGLASCPLDIIRRRTTTTPSPGVNYKSTLDAGS